MSLVKGNIENQVKTPNDKVEIRNRLKEVCHKYPVIKPQIRQFFRDNGIGDGTFDNIIAGRRRYRPLHDKMVDRLILHLNIEFS
ncbi:hypothetical protein GCM10027035_47600 [Emticicia sediminis]